MRTNIVRRRSYHFREVTSVSVVVVVCLPARVDNQFLLCNTTAYILLDYDSDDHDDDDDDDDIIIIIIIMLLLILNLY